MATTEGLSGRGTILRTSLKPLYLTGMVYRLDPFLVLWTYRVGLVLSPL